MTLVKTAFNCQNQSKMVLTIELAFPMVLTNDIEQNHYA
jgi:hypothetical protein